MFHGIDGVTIDGAKRAFGGYIYAVDYKVGVVDNPSEVTISFVNETGVYEEPQLSLTAFNNIVVGNILNGNFYPFSFNINDTPSGKILEVTFKDGSIILDRIWVGLHKRMGDATTNVPGLILVGHEIHPCDVNEDGRFDQEDVNRLAWQSFDPCELRCPGESQFTDPVVQKCIEREITEVFDVKYSFAELLAALGGRPNPYSYAAERSVSYNVPSSTEYGSESITLKLPSEPLNSNSNSLNRVAVHSVPAESHSRIAHNGNTPTAIPYLAAYTGTLRDVLKSWCADFGWSFFWANDGLYFVDTRSRPIVNFTDFDHMESRALSKSLEGTVARGFVSSYGQPGIQARKDCENTQELFLHCLTLRDLYGSYYLPRWNAVAFSQKMTNFNSVQKAYPAPPTILETDGVDGQVEYRDSFYPLGVPIEKLEFSCVMSYYGQVFRDLYNLWEYYRITTPNLAKAAISQHFDRLGQIQLLNVFSSNSTGGRKQLYDDLIAGKLSGGRFISKQDGDLIRNNGGYIVLVKYSQKAQKSREAMYNKQYRLEQNLANDFIGKHWVRAFTSPSLGVPSIMPNGRYLGALSDNVTDLPFASFYPTYRSNVANMINMFAQRQQNNFRQYGPLRFAQDPSIRDAKIVRSMVHYERNSNEMWYPHKDSEAPVKAMESELSRYAIGRMPLSDWDGDVSALLLLMKHSDSGDQDNKIDLQTPDTTYIERWRGHFGLEVWFPVSSSVKNSGWLTPRADIVPHPYPELKTSVEANSLFTSVEGGMMSKNCVVYTIGARAPDSNGNLVNTVLKFYSPQGGSVWFGHQNDRFTLSQIDSKQTEYSKPAYKVFVKSTSSNRGIVPKREISIISPADPDNAAKVEYQTRPLDKDSVRFLNQLTLDCRIPKETLLQIHNALANNLNFSVREPFTRKQFSIYGTSLARNGSPVTLGIANGLESLSVRVKNDGVITDITIGNSLFTPPSPDLITRALENGTNANWRPNPL